MNLNHLKELIIQNLSDDLLSKKWLNYKKQEKLCHPTFGHCYVATEAAYHILGGHNYGWKPFYLKCDDDSHWFLKDSSGIIFDVTKDQFGDEKILYHKAIGKGFLTKQPSKRARKLINRVLNTEKD